MPSSQASPTLSAAETRAEQLAERLVPARVAKKRMLVIVNPYATTVSDRLRNLVVYALQARYELEAVDTERPNHATQICREAAREGYDVVVARRLATDLRGVVGALGVHRLELVARLERVDDEVAQPVGDRRRVGVDDHQHPLLRDPGGHETLGELLGTRLGGRQSR